MLRAKLKVLWRKAAELIRDVIKLRISVYAAHASFFIILSLFPTLVLLLGLLRYTGFSVNTLTDLLYGVLPEALIPAAKNVIINTYKNTTGTLLSVSAVIALWSAGRGVYSLLTGLNVVYGTKESRGYFVRRAICTFYTFLFLLVLLLTLSLYLFSTSLLQQLSSMDGGFFTFLIQIVDLRVILLLLMQTGLFTAMFMALPDCKATFADSFPGAVLASIGWLVFSDLFSRYVDFFPRYANIYGSVYAVALGMLWLYSCVSILFYGGVLNQLLKKKEK